MQNERKQPEKPATDEGQKQHGSSEQQEITTGDLKPQKDPKGGRLWADESPKETFK